MEIKVLLTRRGRSGRWLAGVLGVSQTWMTTRLKGDVPIDLNDLERIAEALEVDIFDLLPRREGRVIATSPETRAFRAPTNGQPKATILTGPKGPSRPPADSPDVPVTQRRPGRIRSTARLAYA